MRLYIVPQDYKTPEQLASELQDLINPGAEVSTRTYGKDKLFLIDITDNGQCVRIIFDLKRTNESRQGIHTIYPDSASDLLNRVYGALDDDFDTIWIH